MSAAATAWLSSLAPHQSAEAHWGTPGDAEAEAERLRWYYTPTDHGGLPLGRQRPAQQSLAMQLVATGLSTAGYVTVCTVMGLENVLDHVEEFSVDWGRERGRDPGMYYLRVFGDPGRAGAVGLALRGAPRLPEQPRRRGPGAVDDTVLHRCRSGSAPLLGPAPCVPWAGRRTWRGS